MRARIRSTVRIISRGVTALLLVAIGAYRVLLSPLLGGRCRFLPSCSEYARASVVRLGPWRGSLRSLGRLARCHPFHPGGYDPPGP